MALKFLSEKDNFQFRIMRISLRVLHCHRTETEGQTELRFVALERGRFPISDMLKIIKTIFSTQFRKNRYISKNKTSPVGAF